MNKKSISTIILMAVVMLLSYWAIDAVSVRFFAGWNEHVGVLAFVFKITIAGLIGFAIARLTERNMTETDSFYTDLEIEITDERNAMIRSKAAFSMLRVNFFLLIAFMLLMINLEIPLAAWGALLLLLMNLVGFFVCFERESKRQ